MSVRRIVLPSISFIVARSYPGNIIGCENKLPWHLKSDLQRFKRQTKGKAVIMGRKTYDSIGRPLPNRKNIVLTRNADDLPDEVEIVNSAEDALYAADIFSILNGQTEYFVIGGDQIYKLFREQCNKIHLTEVFAGEIKGDAFFDIQYDGRQWETVSEDEFPRSEGDEYPFRITVLERRRKTVRMLDVNKFFTDYSENIDHLSEIQKKSLSKKVAQFELPQEELFTSAEIA